MACANRNELSKSTQEECELALKEKERLLNSKELELRQIDLDLAILRKEIVQREGELNFAAREAVLKQKELDLEQREEASVESRRAAMNESVPVPADNRPPTQFQRIFRKRNDGSWYEESYLDRFRLNPYSSSDDSD